MPYVYKYKGKKIRYDDMITLHHIDDNFSYQKYLEEYGELVLESLTSKIDFDDYMPSPITKDPEYDKAECELYNEFSEYAHQYEILYQEKGIDPTKDIKELADLYRQVLSLLEEEIKEKRLKEQRIALITVLKRVCDQKKTKEDAERKERIAAFKEGKISFKELKFGDLKEFETYKQIVDLKRFLWVRFNEELLKLDYDNMTIEEIVSFLNIEESNKRK